MKSSRRTWLKSAALAGAGLCVAPEVALRRAAAGADQAKREQGCGFYRHMLGTTEVYVLSDGTLQVGPAHPTLAANAPEGVVAQAFEKAFLSPTAARLQVNGLLIRRGGDLVLVDAGCGTGMGPTVGRLRAGLRSAGIRETDITAVVLSHLHGDHMLGLLESDKPVFSAAQHFLHADERAFWSSESPDFSKCQLPRERIPGFVESAQRVLSAIEFELVSSEREIRPGVRVIPAPGHTPGHLCVMVDGGGEQLLHIVDLVHHHAVQLPTPEVHVAFDVDPAQGIATRKRILQRAVSERLLLTGAHLPFPSLGHLRAAGDGFEWTPIEWSW